MTKSLDLQKCAIDDLFCPVCRAIMLQILLINASSFCISTEGSSVLDDEWNEVAVVMV